MLAESAATAQPTKFANRSKVAQQLRSFIDRCSRVEVAGSCEPLRCLIRPHGSNSKDSADHVAIGRVESNRHFALAREKLGRDGILNIDELLFPVRTDVFFQVISDLLAIDPD